MGLEAIFTKIQKVQFISDDDAILELDCSISEKHSQESPPTEFEIENGQTISDHIIVKPVELEIQGLVSDTPIDRRIGLLTTVVGRFTPSASVLGKNAAALALLPILASSDSPSKSAYETLLAFQASRRPVNVLTSLHLYINMWITSVSVSRDSKTGKVLPVTIKLRQLLLVSPSDVKINILKNPDVGSAFGDKGRKEAEEPNTAEYNRAYNSGHSLGAGG